jgi:nicotinamidase/pyrazinamidase
MNTSNKIQIKKENTASFDVDPQNGFTSVCPDELPVQDALEIVGFLNKNATFASKRVGSKDAHSRNAKWVATKEKPIFSVVDGDHKDLDIHWTSHCNVGELGFEFIDGLPHPSEYDFMVYKGAEKDMHPYGACYHDLNDTKTTGVIEYLKYNNIDTVIVGGLATDYCVANTAKQLKNAGFSVIVNLESCKGIQQETVDAAIKEMTSMNIVIIESINELTIA